MCFLPCKAQKLRHYSLSFNSCVIMYYHWQTFFWRESGLLGRKLPPVTPMAYIVDRTLTDSRVNMQEHWYSATMQLNILFLQNLLQQQAILIIIKENTSVVKIVLLLQQNCRLTIVSWTSTHSQVSTQARSSQPHMLSMFKILETVYTPITKTRLIVLCFHD